MMKITAEQQEYVDTFYELVLEKLNTDCSIEEIQMVLSIHEEVEDYLGCAGISKALNEFIDTQYDY